MTEWLHELHRQDPWLPLFVCMSGVFIIIGTVALLIIIFDKNK